MAGRLSFSIAINLLTQNFKKGANDVKNAFRNMQAQVLTFAAALGAGGIGLSNLISRFIDVARAANRATTALKNVSGSMGQYADNQRYLLDISEKYGIEIVTLTGNFSKFTAAATNAGVSMADQKDIFESVSRAATAFGLSAEDTNLTFLAITQMMSKGKISSEELRRQLGEHLPIAMSAMAKAAGVPIQKLDKLLQEGKLLSAEVLPKFAKALNEMIPNVNTDNLETSVNRLKNVFTEFVNGAGVQGKYKALVDGLTKILQSGLANMKALVNYTVAAILVILTNRLFNKLLTIITSSEKAAKAAARRAAREAGVAFDEIAWKSNKAAASMKMAFNKAAASVKSAFISMLPTAILTVIGAVVAKLVTMYQEGKRIKNIFSEYKKSLESAGITSEVSKLQTLAKIMNDKVKSQKEVNAAQSELQKMLGKENTSQKELNALVKKRVSYLKQAAMAEYAFNTVGEYNEKNAKLAAGVGLNENQLERLSQLYAGKDTSPRNQGYYQSAVREELNKNGNLYKGISLTDVDKAISEYLQNLRVIADATNRAASYQSAISKTTKTVTPTGDKKKTPLQKQQESYNKQFSELGAELEIGKVTQAEYNKALGELNIKMYAQAKGTNNKQVLESEYYKNLKAAAEKAVSAQEHNAALVELEKVQKDYNHKIKEVQTQYDKHLISQKDLNKNIGELSLEAAKSAAGIKGISDEANVFISVMRLNAKLLATPVKMKPRDATFDYKKSGVDIASEKLDWAKEYAGKLKEQAAEAGQTLSDELANAMANVPTLEEALKIAQVREDIKQLNKDLNENLYSGIKDIASSSDRVVSSFSQLRDVMNDVDASGWEKIMAIWNAMTNLVDSFNSIMHTIENFSEISKKLSGAKNAEESLTQKTVEATGSKAVEIATNQVATELELQMNQKKTQAATTEMAAKSTAAYAGIPFVGLGLATAQIAAMTALIQSASAGIPKFANGGIITGGPTSGDRILARVNAGEMILNPTQQSNLFKAIDSGRLNNTINIVATGEAAVRGDTAFLQMSNYMKRTGKKLPR